MLFPARSKLFSLQLMCLSAVEKCLTSSSVISFLARSKLFNWQLLCVSAEDKCLTPSLVIWLAARVKVFTLQLRCVSAGVKCFTPSSVIWAPMRDKNSSSQKPWLCSLPLNNFAISIHTSDWKLLKLKSKYNIPSTCLSACTNAKQSKGASWDELKSSAWQPVCSSFFWTSLPEALFSYMQLNSVTTKNLSLKTGQNVSAPATVAKEFGRRLLKISADCPSFSASSPATNCITTFHAPSWMWSETNFCRSSELYVSTKYFAAKNSCKVRCKKQYCSLPSAKGWSLVSGKRWNRPLLSRLLTSCDSKINLPSWMPLKAIFPRLVNSFCTEEGSSLNGFRKNCCPSVLLWRYWPSS